MCASLRFRTVITAASIAISLSQPAGAMFAQPQLSKVPIDRLLTNLAKQVMAAPKDVNLKFNLARAYAMAYATKGDEVQVEDKSKAIWYGFEPRNVPFTNKPTKDKTKQREAEKNLAKALETYEAALKLAPDDLVGRLGYAWSLDQAGKKEAAIAEYRKVITAAKKKESEPPTVSYWYRSITAEAAGYLIPLLDETRDAVEIKDLQGTTGKRHKALRPITPIAIPLVDGLRLRDFEDRTARIAFDADGSAIKDRRWSWIKPNAAWLVIDKQNSGKVDSALQMFGNVTFWMFWKNGYEPLAALDDNGDGQLRGKELAGLCLWRDANQNGISETYEVRPLSVHGIVALSCAYQIDESHPDRIEFSPRGVTFASGATRPTFDVRLHSRDEQGSPLSFY